MTAAPAPEPPPDLLKALIAHGLLAFFEDCTPAHKREYLKWIDEAKRPETRARRIEKTIEALLERKAEERGNEP